MNLRLGKPNRWVYAYAILGAVAVLFYARAAMTGWEWDGERGTLAPEVRTSQHGYRTYSYWHDSHVWHGPRIYFWSSPYRGYRWGK